MNKFKIGDWVRDSRNALVGRVDENHRLSHTTEKYKENLDSFLELWQPKEGEWCWFINRKEGPFLLSTFYGVEHNRYTESITFKSYKYCEPFVNTLPSPLKEK